MKRIILLTLVIVLSLPTLAQQTSKSLFDQLTEKYAEKEGFSASQISEDMFDLYIKKREIKEDSPIIEALEDLDNIVVISQSSFSRSAQLVREGYIKAEDGKKDKSDKVNVLHKEIIDHYKKNNFTLLKTENRMGEDVKVYLKKDKGIIESLALITNSSVSTNLVELRGDINLKTVSELSSTLNLRGLENLYKIDNSNSRYGRALGSYYAPSVYSQEKVEEMVARQRELFEKQSKLTDEQRVEIEEQARQMAEKQAQMAEKYREMAENYRRKPIILGMPGDKNTEYYIDGKKVDAEKIKELDNDKIESMEVVKPKKDGDKTTVKIKTK